MKVRMIWDGQVLTVPPEMGEPRSHHLMGSNLDNLCELAGRVCYDSIQSKKSRSSEAYHAHIAEVQHNSTIEHANLVFECSTQMHYTEVLLHLINRPGVYLTNSLQPPDYSPIRFVANLRSIAEWSQWGYNSDSNPWHNMVFECAKHMSPLVLAPYLKDHSQFPYPPIRIVEPKTDDELWVSLYVEGSRGFSHELVRHGNFTAISQRSTRFVDESNSPWEWHPLIKQNWTEVNHDLSLCEKKCQESYVKAVETIQNQLVNQGTDKFTARKQARGAARGALGNALQTALIFSASLSQWKRMISMRASQHADAEIRLIFNQVFDILSEYFPNRFVGYTKSNCSDKIGYHIELK